MPEENQYHADVKFREESQQVIFAAIMIYPEKKLS